MAFLKIALSLLVFIPNVVKGQDDLGLSNGFTAFDAGSLKGEIVKSSQTLASLNATSNSFDFLPSDRLAQLAFNGVHHLGDITLRYRTSDDGAWTSIDSASERKPVTPLNSTSQDVIAAADLTSALPSGLPVKVTREWLQYGNDFAMRFNFTNSGNGSVELGSLGFPISINNIFTERPAAETQEKCALADPYIGVDAGYVQVSHLTGTGSALVVTPLGKTAFEAWRFLKEPFGNFEYQEQTFEGNYEWQVHTLAYAQNEWNSSTPWNEPTSKILQPGEVYSVGLRFSVADKIETIEDTVIKSGLPLAIGLPGYIVPADSTARLYLNHTSPVKNIDAGGAFTVSELSSVGSAYKLTPLTSAWGRARVTILYEDGKTQTVHYTITKSAPSALADMGHFFSTAAYYNDTSDIFNRAPSIMSYDREVNEVVLQDPRVWHAGLSDEAGAGTYLATAMKQFVQPNADEISVVDEFVHETMIGVVQPNDTFNGFSVIASLFYYEPGVVDFPYDSSANWTSWTTWNHTTANRPWRAYNYIHPVATYWSLYRTARYYPDIKLRAEWSWYLDRAYNTIQNCLSKEGRDCDFDQFGLMGEWVLGELLKDLKREGMTTEVEALEVTMRWRANRWEGLVVPFGSEMAWDSTGQEGVYYWTDYFDLPISPSKTINTILAYMPTVAHWGWNGNARRYWDFFYGAKIRLHERQIHHYGSALNALPMLHWYEKNPKDNFHALRIGFAGNTAPLTNIDEEGFASAAFHSFPELLKWDPFSGDYGPGFLGLSLGQCVYIANNARFGMQVFGGEIDETRSTATSTVVAPKDAVRKRVFVADARLKVEISAGAIEEIMYDAGTQKLTLTVLPAVSDSALQAKSAIVWLEQPGLDAVSYTIAGAQQERGGFVVDLATGSANVEITKS